MKILCDENLPGSLALELRRRGHDAVDLRERGQAGIDDDVVLALATTEGRVLLTMDIRRFGNLLTTPPAGTAGFVVIRMPSCSMGFVRRRVLEFFGEVDVAKLAGALTILEPANVRRRR